MTLESILVSEDIENKTVFNSSDELSRKDSQEQQSTIDFKMVTFSLSGKDYAIDIMHVKEIVKAGQFTYVPNVLSFVVGVYNLRGEIIPILDMRLFFNIDVAKRSDNDLENLLIINIEDQVFGIIVDKIDKVVGVQKSTIRPPHPLFSDINVKYISGVVESSKHLYILLDIKRIFSKESLDPNSYKEKKRPAVPVQKVVSKVESDEASASVNVGVQAQETKSVESSSAETSVDNNDYKFIVEGLKNYKRFVVSAINETWVKKRFLQWKDERQGKSVQLQNDDDASEFLKTFWSKATDSWWPKEYADAVFDMLPDNVAKQIVVWNPGCGKGFESYCLACVLAKKYPNSKIRIYAHDIDLLNVSNAPLITVPQNIASSWLMPYLSKNASGQYIFSNEIKESVMFEYHDCLHTNSLPMADIIFARDLLSFIEEDMQKGLLVDFDEKLKGNGVLFIGENEELLNSTEFIECATETLTSYKKQ